MPQKTEKYPYAVSTPEEHAALYNIPASAIEDARELVIADLRLIIDNPDEWVNTRTYEKWLLVHNDYEASNEFPTDPAQWLQDVVIEMLNTIRPDATPKVSDSTITAIMADLQAIRERKLAEGRIKPWEIRQLLPERGYWVERMAGDQRLTIGVTDNMSPERTGERIAEAERILHDSEYETERTGEGCFLYLLIKE